jgi:hypothetical protein
LRRSHALDELEGNMAVTRKDIATDTIVRDKYIDGVLRLKQEVNPQSGLSTYDAMVCGTCGR